MPVGIEPITFEPCCHDEHSPAQRCGAADRAGGADPPDCVVSEVQRDPQRPVGPSRDRPWIVHTGPGVVGYQAGGGNAPDGFAHALFAAGSRRGVHRLVEFSGRLRMWDLKQIPQIELIIRS